MKFNLILSLFFVFQSILVVNSLNVCNDFVGISPSITLDNYPSPGEWPGNSGCIIGDLNCSRILNSPNSNVYLSQSWMTNDISYLYFRTDFKSQATLTNSKSLVLCLESTTSSGLNTVSLCPYSGKPSYLAIVRLVGVNLNLRAIFVNCDQANCNNITQLLQNNNTEIYKPLLINNLTSSSVSHLEFAIPLAYFASDFSSLFVNSFLMNASASANSVTFWESAQLDSVTYNKKCAGSQDSLRFCPFGTESVWQGIEVDGDSSDWPNQAKIDEDPNTGTCLDFPPYSDTCPLCGADNAESAFGLVPGKVDIVHQWSFNDEFSLNIDLQTYFYDSGIPSDPRTYTSGISIRQTSGFFVLCLGKQSSAGSQNYPLCPGFDTDYQLVIMGTENSNMPFVALLLTCASFPINGALGCSQTMSDVVSSVSNYMTTDFGQIKSVFQNAVHLAHAAVSGNSGSGWGSDLEISIPFRFLNVNFQTDLNTKFFFWAIGGNGTVLDYAPNRNPKNEADTEQPNPQDYAVLRCPSINQNGVCSAIAVGPYKTITLDNLVSDWPGNNACDSVEGTNSYCSLLGYDQKESQFSPDCQSGLRTVNSSNCLSAQSDIKGLWMTNDLLNLYVRVDFEAAPFSLTWPKFLAICISTNSPNVGPTLSPFCSAPITNPDFILFVSQGSVSGSPTAFKYVLKDCTKYDCTVTELTSVASVVGVNAGQIGCTGAQCSSNSNSIEMRIPFASLSRQNATRGGVVFAEANLFGSVSPLTLLDFAPDTTKTLPPFYVQCPSLQQCDKQAYVMESGNTFQTCQNKIAYAEFYQVSDRNFTTQFPNQTIKVCGISADGFTLFPGVNSETLSHYGMDVFIYEAGSVDLSGSYNLLAIKSFDPPLDPTVWNSMIPISATLISGRYYSIGFQIWKDSFGVDDVMPKSGLFTFPCRPSTVANSLLSLSQVLSEETNANSLLAKYQFQNATTGWQSPTGAQSYLSPNLLLRFSYSATSSISPTPAPAALSSTNQASKAPTFYNPSQNYGTQCNLVSNQFELSANWADDNIKFINGRFSGAAISYLSLVYGTTRTNAVKGAIGSATAGSQISVAFPENDPIIRMTVMMTGTNALQIVAAVTFQTASGKSRTLGRIPATGAVWNYNGTVSNPIIGLYGCRAGQNFATIYPMIRTAKPAYITEETNVGSADTSSDGTQQTAIIVGVLVGVFCLILLCVAIAYIVHRRKSHSGTQFYDK